MLPHSFELTVQLQELASLSFQPFDSRIEIIFAGRREPVSIVVLRNDSDIEAALPPIPLDVLNIPLSDVVFSLGRVIQVQPHELWNSKLELLTGFGLLLALEIRAAGWTADWAFRFVL